MRYLLDFLNQFLHKLHLLRNLLLNQNQQLLSQRQTSGAYGAY